MKLDNFGQNFISMKFFPIKISEVVFGLDVMTKNSTRQFIVMFNDWHNVKNGKIQKNNWNKVDFEKNKENLDYVEKCDAFFKRKHIFYPLSQVEP